MEDIRAFFGAPKQSTAAAGAPVASKPSKKKMKRVVLSDSDDENPAPKKQHAEKSPSQSLATISNKPATSSLKTVSADDFFGSAVVSQVKREPLPPNKKKSPVKAEVTPTDVAPKGGEKAHQDPMFLETLVDMDKKAKKTPSKTPSKTVVKSEKSPSISPDENRRSPKKKKEDPFKSQTSSSKTPITKNVKKNDDSSPVTPAAPPNTTEKGSAKKGNYATYLSFQNREGPQLLGTKELPRGPDDCLAGKSFVLTGVLECFERDDVKSFIERHGGKVMANVGKSTTYVVLGREPGPSKLAKIEQLKIKTLDEDALLNLVESAAAKSNFQPPKPVKKSPVKAVVSGTVAPEKKPPQVAKPVASSESSPTVATSSVDKPVKPGDSQLWVDKYQAKSMKQIIGQQGDKSNARKLYFWLQHWHNVFTHDNYRGPPKNKDNGLIFRAALLSGVAGVGKTTTATIVAKELGMEVVAMNASDTRSQKLLNTVVSETLKSGSLTNLMTGKSDQSQLNHLLIMDEVDGMAGNEDRGGMSELINLIKKSKVPIICICNDRQHMKVRSLANHCLDLRFQRPRLEQLKSAMMSIAFKEGIKVSPNVLEQLIIGANQDVRQVIHHLQAWFANHKSIGYDEAKARAQRAKKDQKMGPFDACRTAFCFGDERRKMKFPDKLDLFFYDYSLMPLFMQENYLMTTMNRGSNKNVMKDISRAADSFVQGDIASKIIRSTNNWSLLPKMGTFTCVLPGEHCQGPMGQFVGFPRWLGENSKRNKNDRLLQDMQVHMRLHFNSTKSDLNLQIMPVLREKFASCLADESRIEEGVQLLVDMDLTRDDLDTVFSMSQMTDADDPWKRVSTKSKAAFTRAFNKTAHRLPYVPVGPKKRKAAPSDGSALLGGEDEEAGGKEEEEEEEDDDFVPGLISKKAKGASAASGAKKTPASKATKKPAAKTKKDAGPSKKKASAKK